MPQVPEINCFQSSATWEFSTKGITTTPPIWNLDSFLQLKYALLHSVNILLISQSLGTGAPGARN